jgi:hypothetical protein
MHSCVDHCTFSHPYTSFFIAVQNSWLSRPPELSVSMTYQHAKVSERIGIEYGKAKSAGQGC